MNKAEIIFNYVLTNFKLKFEVDESFLKIGYTTDAEAQIRINNSGSSFFEQQVNIDYQTVFYREWNDRRIPFFFGDRSDNVISETTGGIVINVDIIACSFYFLSGWQEQFAGHNDRFGRFSYDESIQKKLDMTILPVVNYYFDILKSAIEKCYGVKLSERETSGFSVILSHDIDELDTLWLQEGYHALKKGKLMAIPGIILNRFFRSRKINDSLTRLLQLEEDNGIRSDFFFLCKKGQDGFYKNADYSVMDAAILRSTKIILAAGHEIGVHGSFHTHNSKEKLIADMSVLKSVTGKAILGNRFHFLSYVSTTTPSVLKISGIKYDSTLGFAEHIGFRNSYANPFFLFDLKSFQATQVMEFPLVLMDASLYFPQYMNCNFEQSLAHVSRLIAEIEKVNGLMVINWHNSGYLLYKNSWLLPLLTEILSECRKAKAVFQTMGALYGRLLEDKIRNR